LPLAGKANFEVGDVTRAKFIVILLAIILLLTGITTVWFYLNLESEKLPAGAKQVRVDSGISLSITDKIALGQV